MVGGRVGSAKHINMFVCREKPSIECFIIGSLHPLHHMCNQCSNGNDLSDLFPNTWDARVLGERLRRFSTETQTKLENMEKFKRINWKSVSAIFVPFKIIGELPELTPNVKFRDLQFFFNLVDKCLNYFVIISDLCLSYIISNSVNIFIWLNE